MENYTMNVEIPTSTEKETLTSQEQIVAEDMSKETEGLLEKIKLESIMDAKPEKRKLVIDKIKALLVIAAAAGIVVAAQNFGALDKINDLSGTAGKEAIMEGAGILTATISSIGIWIRDMYNKANA